MQYSRVVDLELLHLADEQSITNMKMEIDRLNNIISSLKQELQVTEDALNYWKAKYLNARDTISRINYPDTTGQ